MNAICSEQPKFSNDIILPHWKNCTCKWMLMLVNFPCNFCLLRHVLPIAFSYLGLHPITCQFLHFIMYSALTGQSPDRKQPNKEPILLCPCESLWNMIFFSLFNKFLPVSIISSVRDYWRLNRVFGSLSTAKLYYRIFLRQLAVTEFYHWHSFSLQVKCHLL